MEEEEEQAGVEEEDCVMSWSPLFHALSLTLQTQLSLSVPEFCVKVEGETYFTQSFPHLITSRYNI